MLKQNFVPNPSCNFGKNLEVQHDSLFKTMDIMVSYSHTILSTYNLTNFSNEKVCFMGIKHAVLVNLSTIIQIPLKPPAILENQNKKSIVICSHFHFGLGKGYNNSLTLWR